MSFLPTNFELSPEMKDMLLFSGLLIVLILLIIAGWSWVLVNAKDEPGDHKNID